MTVETLGIDIAKNVFQLHGVNHHGCVVLKRRVMRDQLLDIVAQVECCTIVVEACTGAFLLGAQVRGARPPGEDHQPAICEALCAPAEERRQRR
jgi:hypothetical protein